MKLSPAWTQAAVAVGMFLLAACPLRADVYDLVIYGGTPAAVSAAVKAQAMGLKTVVVSPDRHVGGLTVSGLGYTDSGNTAAVGGLARAFYRRIYAVYQKDETWLWQKKSSFSAEGQGTKAMRHDDKTMWTFEPHVAEQVIADWLAETGVAVVKGERLDRGADGRSRAGVEKKDGRIVAFRVESGTRYAGRYFIDATYEGDLLAAAGVSYCVGRESNAAYNETYNGNQPGLRHHGHYFKAQVSPYKIPGDPSSGLCPEIETTPEGVRGTGDKRVQAYCYRLCMTDADANRLPFAKPDAYDRNRYEILARVYAAGWRETFHKFDRVPNLKTDTNNHGPFSADFIGGGSDEWPEASYARRDEIAAAHKQYQMGLCYFTANDPSVPAEIRTKCAKWGLAKDEFTDNGGWPYHIYVREGRRMLGEYVTSEHDCLHRAADPRQGVARGSIGMGSYHLDSHNVRRYVTPDGWVQNEGDLGVSPKRAYPIDYGSIIPRRAECTNLLVPVAVSATHAAFGSIRMEPVFFILGESAATAAAFAAKDGRAVQDVDVAALRERLLKDGQILSL